MAGFPSSFSGALRGLGLPDLALPFTMKTPPANDETARRRAVERARRDADLRSMVETEIIPRLMLAHGSDGCESFAPEADFGDSLTDVFAGLVLDKPRESLLAFLDALVRRGADRDEVLRDLLAPTARRLGTYWAEDRASFTDVTVGLGKLQQLVRELGAGSAPRGDDSADVGSLLLAPAPGEQHTLGLLMVEATFRSGGWRTQVDIAPTQAGLADRAAGEWFDLVGLSVSQENVIESASCAIAAVRRASLNCNVFILVGGALPAAEPDLARRMGADAAVVDASEALHIAGDAIRRRAVQT